MKAELPLLPTQEVADQMEAIYQKHFPEHPFGTHEAQRILSFAIEIALLCFYAGHRIAPQRKKSAPRLRDAR